MGAFCRARHQAGRRLRVLFTALARGETPIVLEAGDAVGYSKRQWSHVRMFSP
jgi:hypothetical protein